MTTFNIGHPVLEAAEQVASRLSHMEEVKRFRAAEEQINKSETVQRYIETIKLTQKELVHAKHFQKAEHVSQLELQLDRLNRELDQMPIVQEYQQCQVYVNDLLQLIKKTLLSSVDCDLSVEASGIVPSGCGSGGACGCKK